MNRVLVCSRQADFSGTLCEELRQRVNCEVIPAAHIDLSSEDVAAFPAQHFIVDGRSLADDLDSCFFNIFHNNPNANVIVLSEKTGLNDPNHFFAIGVQEVLCRPLGHSQMTALANQIAKNIQLFDDSECVHQSLLKQRRGHRIVAKSAPMREILANLPRLASSVATVLIEGETGTGKELIARAIHYLGPRAGGPFVTVDCGAIPESLIENELFGHARGAYTGASAMSSGLLHEAKGGTIYLDEVEALPLNVQTRFLRLLQEREYRPLGQAEYHTVDARAIASTNTDLAEAVRRKTFREDLFHRLNVVRVFIPPLRERKSDIPALVIHFVRCYAPDHEPRPQVPDDLMEQWMRCEWPGNVRELENRIQEWLLHASTESTPLQAPLHPGSYTNLMTLSRIREEALGRSEATYFRQLLRSTKGNISQAATVAGVDRKTLALLLKKRGIDPGKFRSH